MKIKKSDLKIIIENYLLEDASTSIKAMNYIPKKAFSPVIVGQKMSKNKPRLEGTYLGMSKGYQNIKLMYVLIDADEVENIPELLKIRHGNARVYRKLKIDDTSKVMKAGKDSGFSLNETKIQSYIRSGRIVEIMSTNPQAYVYEPLSSDEIASYNFVKTTAIETTSALSDVGTAIATATGAAPVAAAFSALGNITSVADLFMKIDAKDWLGCVFAIIGLIPGGDAVSILKKVGMLEDLPSSVKKELGEAIVSILDGDNRKTLEELVKAYKEDRPAASDSAGMIISNILNAFKKLGEFFINNTDKLVV